MGFGWLTRLGSPFLKIFWADISKNFDFFRSEPETAPMRGEIGSRIAADTPKVFASGQPPLQPSRNRSGLLVRHAA